MSIKALNKMPQKNTTNHVPVLRFPGFSGEWEERRLGEIADRVIRKNKEDNKNVITISAQQGLINQEKFFNKSVSAKDITGYYLLYKGDFAYNKSYSSGYPMGAIKCLNNYEKGVVSTLYICFKFRVSNSNPFFEHYFSTGLQNKEIEKVAQEGARNHGLLNVGINDFFSIYLKVPCIEEQQKIAEFLELADAWIENLRAQKISLESYKKAIMQKLFSQEIRFKDGDGQDFPDWVEKKLGNFTRIYDGTHQTPDYKKEGIPFYSVEHITANNFSDTKFVSPDIFEKENKRVRLEKNDILMTRIGDIGTARLIDWEIEASFYVSLALIKKSKIAISTFLAQYINSSNFQKELWKRTIHVAFPKKINLGEIGECNVILPSLQEQQKIANFLTSIDKKIESKQKQITQAEQWKCGLMQGLFV